MGISYFDALCCTGRYNKWRPGLPSTVGDLIADMDHYGVDASLVTGALARESDTTAGNLAAVEAARTHPDRLVASWVLTPTASSPGESPPPDTLLAELHRNNVRAGSRRAWCSPRTPAWAMRRTATMSQRRR